MSSVFGVFYFCLSFLHHKRAVEYSQSMRSLRNANRYQSATEDQDGYRLNA